MLFLPMPEVLSTFRLHLGDTAPGFSLPDAAGKIFTPSDCAGSAGLLVVFACNHCPFVIHLADALGEMAHEIAGLGVGTVAINSNDVVNYPQDGAEHMPAFAVRHGWTFPYLLDSTQETAIAYGAACTPDFFLFDAAGKLVYAGQFDDTRPRSDRPVHGGDLREAVRRLVAGEGPMPRQYPSSGCSIKWMPGKQPGWWNCGT
jgi:peroxiredoxin